VKVQFVQRSASAALERIELRVAPRRLSAGSPDQLGAVKT
jgi:hypothetical protein